jgi:U2-associated protein SR140
MATADSAARGLDLEHANRRGQTGLTGFVAYMKRPAAEKAVAELDGLNWGGSVIHVAFGNPVRVPARPIYGQYDIYRKYSWAKQSDLGNESRKRSRSPSPKRNQRRDDRPSYADTKITSRNRSRSRSGTRSSSPPPRQSAAKDRWLAKIPADEEDFVRSVARTVKDHGERYEENLKANQRSNPQYAFLFDDNVSHIAVFTHSRLN